LVLERWGTQSVKDHLDLTSLVTNVILYDRLVFPVPANMGEAMHWREQGWDPELLNNRLELLGDLAVKRPWDEARQQMYERALAFSYGLDYDVGNVIAEKSAQNAYPITRMVLAQEEQLELPSGATRVDVVAAFNSFEAVTQEAAIGVPDDRSTLAMLIQHEILIPDATDPLDALRIAISLSADSEFKGKRRDFYEWQDQIITDGVKPELAVEEMHELLEGYNACVQRAMKEKVRRKFAFTVCSIGLQLASALVSGNPLPAVSALVQFISFKALDGRPPIDPGKSRPAAMFYDVKKLFS
jgi:hypothetical protein